MDTDAPEAHASFVKPMADTEAARIDEHERNVRDTETFEAWGYMFKTDKTSTDKLKALLKGLKNLIVSISITNSTDKITKLIVFRMRATNHRTTRT
jgi:hypothetical protein